MTMGCETTRINNVPVVIETPPLNVSPPPPLVLNDVEWVVIPSENSPTKTRLFGLTEQEYNDLIVNQAKIQAWILQSRGVILAQKKYYETSVVNDVRVNENKKN